LNNTRVDPYLREKSIWDTFDDPYPDEGKEEAEEKEEYMEVTAYHTPFGIPNAATRNCVSGFWSNFKDWGIAAENPDKSRQLISVLW